MKIEITIVGTGERKAGMGKTGKPYDFVPVAFTFEDKRMEGVNAACCNVPGGEFEQYGIRPGSVVEALVLYRNYQPYIAAFL